MVTKGTNVVFKFNKVIKICKKLINPERKILDEKYYFHRKRKFKEIKRMIQEKHKKRKRRVSYENNYFRQKY